MKRLGNLENGHMLTTGEKALLGMVVAGMFGYWAGFNVSSSLPDPFPAAVAAAPQPAAEPALSLTLDPAAVEAEEQNAKQDDPPAPTF
jgi:hypothetical protein